MYCNTFQAATASMVDESVSVQNDAQFKYGFLLKYPEVFTSTYSNTKHDVANKIRLLNRSEYRLRGMTSSSCWSHMMKRPLPTPI